MTKKKAWLWSTARIALAVILLVAIFKYSIRLRDTVTLKDGGTVQGTLVELGETEALIRINGEVKPIPVDLIASKDGEPDIERGLLSILKGMTFRGFLLGCLLLGFVPAVAAERWRMLLVAQGLKIGYWRSLELTLIGLFFNNVMPGLTGGDLVKAYYAAKITSERKTHAVVTVFLDRIIGMVALGLVAALALGAGLAGVGRAGGGEFQHATWFVAFFVVASFGGGLVFYSRRLRAVSKSTVKLLPGYARLREAALARKAVALLKRIDEALFLYRYKKLVLVNTMLISLFAHALAILSIYCFGRALAITGASLLEYFVIVPVSFIISSIPLTPAGWGVGEAVFKFFFGAVGVAGTAAVTMSVIYRLTQALWTLPGGVMLMFQRDRATVEEVEAQMGGGLLGSEDAAQGD